MGEYDFALMLEPTRLATNLKYPWQEAVLDTLKKDKPERRARQNRGCRKSRFRTAN
jgi:hypothetical protein